MRFISSILETSLASSHLTKTASRDPELTYNKMSVQSLSVLTQPPLLWPAYLATGQPPKGIDWVKYFKSIGRFYMSILVLICIYIYIYL
jgi:hypothetical protein